ncbi:MAG: xylulokinase [Candidatus Helarchaeota archaeon]
MRGEYILAHDMGTSGTVASLVELGEKGEYVKIKASAIQEYDVIYPKENYAEQDPHVWWRAITQNAAEVVKKAGIEPDQIKAIIHSTQMLGCMPVDKNGQPLMNCMIWMDTRASKQSIQLWADVRKITSILRHIRRVLSFLKITGAGPMTRDMYSKIMWVKEERPTIYQNTYKFLDVIDWLILKSTGIYATPVDYAGVTFMMDVHKFKWSEKVLSYGDVDLDKLNEIKKCTDVIGELTSAAAKEMNLQAGIPVVCGCGDASAALAGSGAVDENDVHLYIGSSGWLMAPVSKHLRKISAATAAVPSPDPEIPYQLIAEQKNMGACLKWLRDTLERKESYADLDNLASKAPPGSNNLIFTPWIFGESCPVIEPRLRGGFINLSIENTRYDVIRAVLEGVSYNARWALQAGVEPLVKKNGGKITEIRYIGGGAVSDIWCQIMADILGKDIIQMANPLVSGTIGGALVAALGIGELNHFRDFKAKIPQKKRYSPNNANKEIYDKLYNAFRSVHRRLQPLYRELNPGDF